jgi:DME family drug/metabolite transporter
MVPMRFVVFVLLAAVCFGTTGTAQALGPDGVSAASVGAARILIGGGALALVAFVLSRRTVAAAPAAVSSTRWQRALLITAGALGVLAYQPAFFAGTAANGVAVGTIVALGSAPVITGALEWALTRRFPGAIWLVATVVATAGVTLLSGVGSAASVSVPGLLASLGAGASYALYTLASKALITRGVPPTTTMGWVFGVAAAASVPLLLSADVAWLASPDGLAMALWLGLVTTTLAYVLFAQGLRHLSAATVSTLTLAEPLTATLLGLLVLRESLGTTAVVGLLVLAVGLAVLSLEPIRSRRRAERPSD